MQKSRVPELVFNGAQSIPTAAPNPLSIVALASESGPDAAEGDRMNNEILCVLANTLMDCEIIMILGYIQKGDYNNKCIEKFFKHCSFFNFWNPRSTAALLEFH
jgi:hypothetical protein